MPLYRVTCTAEVDVMVVAPDGPSARILAEQNAADEFANLMGSGDWIAQLPYGPVTKLTQVPSGWKDGIPYREDGDNEATCTEIITEYDAGLPDPNQLTLGEAQASFREDDDGPGQG